jgi:hypothetical protein
MVRYPSIPQDRPHHEAAPLELMNDEGSTPMNEQKPIEELERVLLRLEQAADQCNRKVLRSEEAQKALDEAHQCALAVLPKDSTAQRLYDRTTRQEDSWWGPAYTGYAGPTDCKKLENRIALIRSVINEIEPEFLHDDYRDKNQFYFTAGDSYRPKKQVFGVMKKATTALVVVDGYLDEQVFDYIESLSPGLRVRLLTGRKKPVFQSFYKSLKAQRSTLSAKFFAGCHDRFLVIDDIEVWHLGASINGFGKDAFMFNKVIEDEERTRFLMDLRQWWQNGEDLSV